METYLEISWSQVKQTVDYYCYQKTGKYLSDVELLVLKGSWQGQTYEEIATLTNYTGDYLSKDVEPPSKLWRKMSMAFDENISKKNFRGAVERASEILEQQHIKQASILETHEEHEIVEFPEGVMAGDSPLYLNRGIVETLCYDSVRKPGALIRIKGPKLMGKSSLLTRILAAAQTDGNHAIYLDLGSIEHRIKQDLDKLLQWLCVMVTRQLGLVNGVQESWDTEILGSNDNCSVYFEEFILPQLDQPIILGFDNVDEIFEYNQVVEDFLGMLRSWHEKSKIYPQWSQIKIVLVHSTECYIPLDLNQSPFNAGVPVELKPFTQKQVIRLVELYGLPMSGALLNGLVQMLGGHPYLLQLALFHVKVKHQRIEDILQKAATEEGIFRDHLRRYLLFLKDLPDLADALKSVVQSQEPVLLDSIHIYRLHSMGVIQAEENRVVPSCQLYRDFFQRVL